MALPAEILDAIIAVLDAEALRTDFDSRVRLLQATSATIEDGRAGASRPSKLSSSSAQPLRPQGRSQGRGRVTDGLRAHGLQRGCFEMTSAQQQPRAPAPPAEHVAQNVETIASLRARADGELSAHQRRIEWATAALGHPWSMYVILLIAAAWAAMNTGMPHVGLAPLDPPPFSYLQAAVGLGALLMTVMVLTTQNRQSKYAEQRDHLDLQVNLLAEQKVAKLIALVEELRRDMPSVPDRVDPIAEVMTEPLDPHAVVNAMEHTLVLPPEAAEPTDPAPSGVEAPDRRRSRK